MGRSPNQNRADILDESYPKNGAFIEAKKQLTAGFALMKKPIGINIINHRLIKPIWLYC